MISLPLLVLAAAATLCAAAYAHHRIGHQVSGAAWIWGIRGVFALTGTGLGWLVGTQLQAFGADPLARWLLFAFVFGLVHVPAAIILHLKRLRVRQDSYNG